MENVVGLGTAPVGSRGRWRPAEGRSQESPQGGRQVNVLECAIYFWFVSLCRASSGALKSLDDMTDHL